SRSIMSPHAFSLTSHRSYAARRSRTAAPAQALFSSDGVLSILSRRLLNEHVTATGGQTRARRRPTSGRRCRLRIGPRPCALGRLAARGRRHNVHLHLGLFGAGTADLAFELRKLLFGIADEFGLGGQREGLAQENRRLSGMFLSFENRADPIVGIRHARI